MEITEYLNQNKFLSNTYRLWYKRLFRSLMDSNSHGNLNKYKHPHYILREEKLNRVQRFKIQKICGKDITVPNKEDIIYATHNDLSEIVPSSNSGTFANLFSQSPSVSSSSLFLSTGNSPKFIFSKNNVYVAVKVKEPQNYLNTYKKLTEITEKNLFQKIQVSTIDNIGIVLSENNFYFISEYKGYDYETEIIEFNKINLTEELIDSIKFIRKILDKEGLFYRDLSPRNSIKGEDGKFYLIDFEHLYERKEENFEKICMKRFDTNLWFNDLLTSKERKDLASRPNLEYPDLLLKAPSFERKFFNKESITLQEAGYLAMITENFEVFNNCYGFKVYGHQLGRFISDFWEEDSEIDLHRFLEQYPTETKYLRAVLYLLSRVDQELKFRQEYAIDFEKNMLSERYFYQIYHNRKHKLHHSELSNLYSLINDSDEFNEVYAIASKCL